MKRIAFLLLLSVTFTPYSALALTARTVSIEQAQGISGSIITLEVAPGYGLNINLIPTGEVVKKAWIDDPSRITLSFDGNLCQGVSNQQQQCNNEGATVIHLRQIQPIQFPNLPRSSGGGTLLTLITESSQRRKIYQFKVVPVSGQPKYTVLNVSPDNPSNTPLLRNGNAPLMVNNFQRRKRSLNNFQQPQNTARTEWQRNPKLEEASTITPAEANPQTPIPKIQPETVSTPKTLIPVETKLAPIVPIPNSETSPLRPPEHKPKQTSITPTPNLSMPVDSKPARAALSKPKTSLPPIRQPAPVTTVSSAKTPPQPSNAIKSQPSTSIAQANALVRGLVIAHQKGHINNKTKVWRQVQSVVLLLRRGVTKKEAVKKVGVSLQLIEQLIVWGSNSKQLTFTSFN